MEPLPFGSLAPTEFVELVCTGRWDEELLFLNLSPGSSPERKRDTISLMSNLVPWPYLILLPPHFGLFLTPHTRCAPFLYI